MLKKYPTKVVPRKHSSFRPYYIGMIGAFLYDQKVYNFSDEDRRKRLSPLGFGDKTSFSN